MGEPFPAEGLPLVEARARVLADITPLEGAVRLPLGACLGRVSAEACHASEALPGFRAAILDGYAIAGGPVPPPGTCWRVVGRSSPGVPYPGPLAPGQAIRILTGAPLPERAGRVLPQELVAVEGDTLTLRGETSANPWIRAADEEAAAGQELLGAGQRLGPADLARLASCGLASLVVRPQPRLGVLISGDELVPPGQPRTPGAIWESNGTLLEALLARLGQPVAERRVVGDDPEALGQALESLASTCEVVVSTGGVSAGDADWIRPLLAKRGEVAFWKLFLKPGRPFAYGRLGGRPFFGLPGNPVAAAITALQLLWPALQRLEGSVPEPLPRLQVRLATPLKRGSGRPELARARLRVNGAGELLAEVDGSQASSRIGSLAGADLLLEIPAELGNLEAGQPLWAQLLRLPIF
ncbi:MAG: molybdopterin molybdotransferase MoeA [Cyanobacteriota bacterium]|nr:molybdopterin molybdotransferase MoeA [Cyanobacteriota bacterium]